MRPTEELVREHEVIQAVLDAAWAESARIAETSAVRADITGMLLDFFRGFTDRCHHSKEERHLFPMLGSKGLPQDRGPIAVMLFEHAEGRRLLSAVERGLKSAVENDASAWRSIAENLASYVNLLQDHIAKENGVLFPMADRILSSDDQLILHDAFERVEEMEAGSGAHGRYHELARAIMELALGPRNSPAA
jgi:hemerythrin-like domain-containing protein